MTDPLVFSGEWEIVRVAGKFEVHEHIGGTGQVTVFNGLPDREAARALVNKRRDEFEESSRSQGRIARDAC
jgi:hypothetical protein